MKGLEPPRLSAPDPKSGTATNYATSASDYLSFFALKRKWLQIQSLSAAADTNYATSHVTTKTSFLQILRPLTLHRMI